MVKSVNTDSEEVESENDIKKKKSVFVSPLDGSAMTPTSPRPQVRDPPNPNSSPRFEKDTQLKTAETPTLLGNKKI